MLVLDSWAQNLSGASIPSPARDPGEAAIQLTAPPPPRRPGGGSDSDSGAGAGVLPLQRRAGGGGGGSSGGSPERRKPSAASGVAPYLGDPPPSQQPLAPQGQPPQQPQPQQQPFRMLGSRGGSVLLGLLVHSAADGLAVGAAALGLEPTVSAAVAAAMVGHKVGPDDGVRAPLACIARPRPRT
jgi:hypothetical protein